MLLIGNIVRHRERLKEKSIQFCCKLKIFLKKKKYIKYKSGNQLLNPESHAKVDNIT